MLDFNRNVTTTQYGTTVGQAVEVDAGLRAYMLRVYNYMVIGLAITGFAALGIYMLSITNDPAQAAKAMRGGAEVAARISANAYLTTLGYTLFVSPLKWAIILAPLAMVFVLSFGMSACARPRRTHVLDLRGADRPVAGLDLYGVQALRSRGCSSSPRRRSAHSACGATTQRDLSGMGSFLIMGLFGVILASLVNLFLQAPMLQFVISIVGVLVFAGLTAYDTQRLKSEYLYGAMDGETTERSAISARCRSTLTSSTCSPC